MGEQNNMVNNQSNECKCKKKSGLSVVLVIIGLAAGVTIGYFGNNILSINSKEEKTEEKSNELKQESSNVVEESNTNVESTSSKSYTINDIVGTFEAGNAKLFLSSKGIFSQEYKQGCGIYEENYLLDENAITLYPITFFTCELSTTEIVKDKEIKIEIISKDELSVDGTTYKRIDSKNFDDSASGLRYLFKTAIESLPSE